MSAIPTMTIPDQPDLTIWEKLVTVAAWAAGVVLFLSLSQQMLAPRHPLDAVSLLTAPNYWMMWLQAALFACGAAVIGSILAGRIIPDVGTFTAVAGLAAVSLRGATTESMLVRIADGPQTAQHRLAFELFGEALAWIVIAAICTFVSAWVVRSLFERSGAPEALPRSTRNRVMAGYDVPRVGATFLRVDADRLTNPSTGFKHIAIASIVGCVALFVLGDGLDARTIRHGQTCFLVAVAVALGGYFAQKNAPVRSALWSMVGSWLIVIVAYLWASLRPINEALPANVPTSHVLHILPIQFVSVGTAAAVAMFWYAFSHSPRDGQRNDPANPSRRPG